MGGMERVMSQLAIYFYENKNADVDLVLLAKRERFFILPPEINIYEPDLDFQKHSKLLQTVKIFNYLRSTISKLKPDTILSFCERYNSFVILSLLFLRFNIFVSDRASPYASSGKFVDLLNRFAYRFSTGIIAQTQIAKEIQTARYGHKNITVIGNPLKFVERNPNVKRENIILNLGRFSEKKNQHLLVKYFKEINDLSWKIIFLGDGYNMNKVVKLTDELGLNDNVEFAERTTDIENYFSKSKIFAFTSTSEGFPNALGEALSTPLACISFDCVAGPSDLIENNVNGFLIKEHDDTDYINKLKLLMNDENLRTKFETNALIKIQKYRLNEIGDLFYNFILPRNKTNSINS